MLTHVPMAGTCSLLLCAICERLPRGRHVAAFVVKEQRGHISRRCEAGAKESRPPTYARPRRHASGCAWERNPSVG
jgi:hypothetical protein